MAKKEKYCDDCKGQFLKEIPHDVYGFILDKQVEMKKKKIKRATIPDVIYAIIKEWDKWGNTEPLIGYKKNGDFEVLRDLDDYELLHIKNMLNTKSAR